MRQIFLRELVGDIEDPKQLDRVLQLLQERKLSYQVWATGSRGYHIHLWFDEFAEIEPEYVVPLKKKMIETFGTDPCKASHNTMIACEFAKHFKTGRVKTLKDFVPGKNVLPQEVLEYLEELRNKPKPKPITFELVGDWIRKDKALQFVLNNKIPPGIGRYSTLCKNICIGLVRSGASNDEINVILDRILENMVGRDWDKTALLGWVNAAKEGRYTRYNPLEIAKWLERYAEKIAEVNPP
jgi:hypothetical protein